MCRVSFCSVDGSRKKPISKQGTALSLVLPSTPQIMSLIPSGCRQRGDCWVSSSAIVLGLMEVLPDNCVQVGKKELLYTGFVGLIMYLGGVIFINRKSTTSAKMVMSEVAKTMVAENVSVTMVLGGVAYAGHLRWHGGMWHSWCWLICSSWQGWLVARPAGRSTSSGLLERSLISPCAGEGVGVPRGHEELHRGLPALQERSVSSCYPGTGNGAVHLLGTLGVPQWVLYTGHAAVWFICSLVSCFTAELLS